MLILSAVLSATAMSITATPGGLSSRQPVDLSASVREEPKRGGLSANAPTARSEVADAGERGDRRPRRGEDARAQGRVMPPQGLRCDRNDLTLYDGRVLTYRRRKGSTLLRIRTSFDTTEEVTIRHAGTDDPSEFYLLDGGPFKRSDWRRIERRRGVLKKGMRANVWVCRDDPSVQPVVDWRPGDTGAYPRSR